MCTLILVRESGRLRMAANRDERLSRPTSPPRWHPGQGPGGPGLWPVDEEAGGTWLGINEAGVLAAITNRFWTPVQRDRPSRGRWVPRALVEADASSSLEGLQQTIDPRNENGFHLVVADAHQGGVLVSDGETLSLRPLPPGLTVLTERSFGPSPVEREARIHARLSGANLSEAAMLSVLEHRESPTSIDDVDVDLTTHGYGTRSRTTIELTPGRTRLQYRDVRPDPTPWITFQPKN